MIVFVLLADLLLVQDLVTTLVVVVEEDTPGRSGGRGGGGRRPLGGGSGFLRGRGLRWLVWVLLYSYSFSCGCDLPGVCV